MNFTFRRARLPEAEAVVQLIAERIRWMDEKGLRGWNCTHYLDIFPLSYFQQECAKEHLYVLAAEDGTVEGAVILLDEDERWAGIAPENACYLHNLVSSLHCPGAGKTILDEVESLARRNGKHSLCLDCAKDNAALNRFYENAGYLPRGNCSVGEYHGILREKAL